EKALENIIHRVVDHRTLPDPHWQDAALGRTRSAMRAVGEKEEGAELLLQAFWDVAPFPLGAAEAYTVAGFEGTQEDAERLLQTLYTKGVLDRRQTSPDRFVPAPPPSTPGAAVLLKVDTGEILAIASKPDYDLNDFSPRIPASVWRDVNRRGALLPRALNPGYPPASTYKLATAIAALRKGTLALEYSGKCDGIYKGMECHVFPGRHGEMTLVDAIAQSCNIFFFRVGEKAGPKALIEESKLFGMHEVPTIEMPSLPDHPIVPDPEWKLKRIGENWKLEDTFNVSIGQGGFKLSPLRMACFAASLARGETRTLPTLLYRPSDALPVSHRAVPIGLPSEHYNAIVAGMAKSATDGTARRCKVEGIKLAGKTGTGEWRNNNMQLNVAWFIGFAPLEKPEVAVAILIEGVVPQDNIQGGLTATSVAQKILQAYFDKKKSNLAAHP
ncbi:MAG: penicillin-binding transpeptidase domain-containing protein, partial [Opitutales bacterium]